MVLHVLEEVDALARCQGHVGFLPARTLPLPSTDPARLAEVVHGSNLFDLHFEKRFDRTANLDLVGLGTHPKDELIPLLIDERALLGDDRRGNHVQQVLHPSNLFRSASTASWVTIK